MVLNVVGSNPTSHPTRARQQPCSCFFVSFLLRPLIAVADISPTHYEVTFLTRSVRKMQMACLFINGTGTRKNLPTNDTSYLAPFLLLHSMQRHLAVLDDSSASLVPQGAGECLLIPWRSWVLLSVSG